MKKNIFLFISVILFVFLFYKQDVALNLSLFGIVAWAFLFCSIEEDKKSKSFWLLSVATFISILSFAWYGDFISFASLFASILLTAYRAYYPRLNLLTSPAGIAFNYLSSLIRIPLLHKWLILSMPGGDLLKKIAGYVVIPSVLAGLFITVYTYANDRFASYFTINWQVNIFQVIGLSIIGFFFMFGFFHFSVPKILIRYNRYTADDFPDTFVAQARGRHTFFDTASQRRSGEISMILLNLVLIFFIIVYIIDQFGSGSASGTLSEEVHERVYVLILSIVMAVVVIMIYFRGLLNFDANATRLKIFSLIWIGLNLLLILTVVFQNLQYVSAYGLTFKRIGVFIFLLLSIAGLLLTYYKIMFRKTNAFLVNRVVWMFYAALVISCGINWSWIVTKYNTAKFSEPDWKYLYSLNYNKQLIYELNKKREVSNADLIKEIRIEKTKPALSRKLYYACLHLQ